MDLDGQPPPDAAEQGPQAQLGPSSGADRGQPAPISGPQGPQQADQRAGQQQQAKQRRPEPNPLRNLGDALERWRADLAVQHEAPGQQEEGEEAAAGPEAADPPPQQQPPGEEAPRADEYQFLGQHEDPGAGDTQALAPATEEQAAAGAAELARREAGEEAGAPDAAGEEEAAARQLEQEAAGGDEDMADAQQLQAQVAASAPAPRRGQGSQRDARLAAADSLEPEDAEGPGSEAGEGAAGGQLGEGEGGPEDLPSVVAAQLAATQLQGEEEGGDAAAAAAGLAPEEAAALRAQLEERLREAAAAAAAGGGGEEGGEAALEHGRAVWARCEALTAGGRRAEAATAVPLRCPSSPPGHHHIRAATRMLAPVCCQLLPAAADRMLPAAFLGTSIRPPHSPLPPPIPNHLLTAHSPLTPRRAPAQAWRAS
jgi:midasin